MELTLIADRTGITVRKLRYVLDHGLLPGGKEVSRGRGAARYLTPFEGFSIATAALMLEAGLKRALVRDCLAALVGAPRANFNEMPFYRAFRAERTARLEVGDWSHVRLSGTGRSSLWTFDTNWLPLAGGGAAGVPYEPLVTVALDVGQIRRKVGNTG